MSNQLFMGELGLMLNDNGYKIIPVVKRTKRPALTNWSRIKSTPELIESWPADASIGITTGDVLAIDIDCYDKHVTNAIVKFCDQHIGRGLRRIGKAPRRCWSSAQERTSRSQYQLNTQITKVIPIVLKCLGRANSLLHLVFILILKRNTFGRRLAHT